MSNVLSFICTLTCMMLYRYQRFFYVFFVLSFSRYFEDYTAEENNFLKIFHILTKIVYSVIKNEFNTLCTNDVLDIIRRDIYDHQFKVYPKDSHKDEHKRQNHLIYLTRRQREQLFSPASELSVFHK